MDRGRPQRIRDGDPEAPDGATQNAAGWDRVRFPCSSRAKLPQFACRRTSRTLAGGKTQFLPEKQPWILPLRGPGPQGPVRVLPGGDELAACTRPKYTGRRSKRPLPATRRGEGPNGLIGPRQDAACPPARSPSDQRMWNKSNGSSPGPALCRPMSSSRSGTRSGSIDSGTRTRLPEAAEAGNPSRDSKGAGTRRM